MTDRHFDNRHHEAFWTITVYEIVWAVALAAVVISGLILGLSAVAH